MTGKYESSTDTCGKQVPNALEIDFHERNFHRKMVLVILLHFLNMIKNIMRESRDYALLALGTLCTKS